MNMNTLHEKARGMNTRHFLVVIVCGLNPIRGGDIAVEFWGKNWSRRRLKVLTKRTARRQLREVTGPIEIFVPSAEQLAVHDFPWNEGAVFQVFLGPPQ